MNPNTGTFSVMRKSDLQGYRAVYRQPVSTTYRGFTVYGQNMVGSCCPALVVNHRQLNPRRVLCE